MSTSADVPAITVPAWGEYVPGHRIEIEPVDFSGMSWSGWGPCDPARRDVPARWLVQRDRQSPHPITWHSEMYASYDEARAELYRLELKVPHLSQVIADVHWSLFGCEGDKDEDGTTRAVVDCRHKGCVQYARTLLKAVAEDAPLVLEMLERTEGSAGDHG